MHLAECLDCRQFYERLERTQFVLKSLRHEGVTADALTGVRRDVLSRIDSSRQSMGWALKLDRLIWLGFRKPAYAMAGIVFLAIVSFSLLGQMRHTPPGALTPAALFDRSDALLRPHGYRDWVFLGNSPGLENREHRFFHNVYIDPSSYRNFAATGRFPEGTVLILEAAGRGSPSLEVSVKDSSRFEGGWGFFNFMDSAGDIKPSAPALPEATGCRSCHETRAETDHVFTQFYPVLRSIGTRS
jgi:hypothetical protein